MPEVKLGNLVQTFADLSAMDDDSLEDLEAKEKRYADFVGSTGYQSAQLLADAWCAAFVWRKDKGTDDCITEGWFRRIEANPHSAPPWMKSEVARLRDQYQFFHWHLSFPDVFRLPGDEESPDNGQTGWMGGFDVVHGNPPWERVKLQEKEWFAQRDNAIANAPTAAARHESIARLESRNPDLYRAYADARRNLDAQAHFCRSSGRFPYCARGDINTYAIFAETNTTLIGRTGRAGFIIQSDIATADTYKEFFEWLLDHRRLVSFYDFVNTEGIFPAIHRTHPHFCLITLTGDEHSEAADFCVLEHEHRASD